MSTDMTHAEPQLSHPYRSPVHIHVQFASRPFPSLLHDPDDGSRRLRSYFTFLFPPFSQDDVSPRKTPLNLLPQVFSTRHRDIVFFAGRETQLQTLFTRFSAQST